MSRFLRQRSRKSGAALRYEAPGVYRVYGDREVGARMALEAVEEAVKEWCRRVNDEER